MCPAPYHGQFNGSIAYAQLYNDVGGSITTINAREWNPIKFPAQVYDPVKQGRLSHNIQPYIPESGYYDQFGFKVTQEGLYRVMFSMSYNGGYVAADDNMFVGVCKNEPLISASTSSLLAPNLDTLIYYDTFTYTCQMNMQGILNLSPDDFITFVLDIKTAWTTPLVISFMHLTVYNLDQLGVK